MRLFCSHFGRRVNAYILMRNVTESARPLAERFKKEKTKVFQCPSCGAEIIVEEE